MHNLELPNTTLYDVLLRLDEREKGVVALASSTTNGWGKLLCWNPHEVFRSTANNAAAIASELEVFVQEQREKNLRVVGFLSYDFGALHHSVTLKSEDDLKLPLAFAASYANWLEFKDGGGLVCAAEASFLDEVANICERSKRDLPDTLYEQNFIPAESRPAYREKFQKVKQYICSGDVYQVNLTHRLEATSNVAGRDLFGALSQASQSDFQSYIEANDFEVLSLSPERFVKMNNQHIETSPIKGTRPRGASSLEDKKLEQDLQNNHKDRAELNMITDLLRNDLGAVCRVGTVEVTNTRTLTAYPTLWHAHSTIRGELDKTISPVRALTQLMPGGSITGCPKKRAIEIIDELESAQRGIYTGSIFTVDQEGNLDSNIAIRTIIKKSNRLYLSVGGGIVNDSVEEEEYEESIDKAASFLRNGTSQLSSDILEQQFGATELEIIYQNDNTRIICTKTITGDRILELSKVEFIQAGVEAYPSIHQGILKGKSMGKAFRERAVGFIREERVISTQELPSEFTSYFKGGGLATVVIVSIFVGPDKIPYANILETYNPDVVWPASNKPNGNILQAEIENFAQQLAAHSHR